MEKTEVKVKKSIREENIRMSTGRRERGFEIIKDFREEGIPLPSRKTDGSAGYDVEAARDVTIPARGIAVVPTGLKAFMLKDEYLGIHIRSGLSFKKGVSLINDEGIIDSDYYNNPDNEGHIMIGFINHTADDVLIKKGERIAQGIFKKFLKVDGDDAEGQRNGGFGSTGR